LTRVAYVTAHYPFGPGEAFLGPEARELARRTDRLYIIPTRPEPSVVHADARPLLSSTLAVGLVSASMLRSGVPTTVTRVRRSRSPRVLCKNLAIAPKAAWLARTLDRLEIDHVHAHWGGTSSTMTMLACEQAGIPWSMTLHRWDIDEDNLLAEKVASASFVRTISLFGAGRLRDLVPTARPEIIHMGVDIPPDPAPRKAVRGRLRLLAVGSLTPQKGHARLIDAIRLAGRAVTLEIVGDGPLRGQLEAAAHDPRLDGRVRFLGGLPHTDLLQRLRRGDWDAFVHASPSGPGLDEGIPVALMEAMAAGVPTIASRSGGVPELLGNGAGILVDPTSTSDLAARILELAQSPDLADDLARRGITRIRAAFDAAWIADDLAARFSRESRK
jgi:glycosyltransferase involved in cell wall biosynthesis